jgi:hypothetical protein
VAEKSYLGAEAAVYVSMAEECLTRFWSNDLCESMANPEAHLLRVQAAILCEHGRE